ncbi:NUDIX domain-containing protein [Paractinoplanes abujensis]|uniref:8-oxo-dGTP pyrophosphatase MutT (NUDIX family) n=1 Tax=Paractinoplanes abujensis TaxID=882441 RepID=A0A7W7CUJ9_9ACTN|nr:NUDIX hydrolase [Actinoplanes abujensis]MBB4694950.1 8-oxo-dGTP pyrophosphatase MutT (NUDIX family) [Actinoplanes abujensis]
MTSGDFWTHLPTKLVGAGALLTDDAGRFLVVEPTYKPEWEIPGGVVEAGESPRTGVRRELREELGLAIDVTDLLVIDWSPPPPGQPGRPDGLMLVFDAGVLPADEAAHITLPADELRSHRWCTDAEAATLLAPRLARRMTAARKARAAGTLLYLEEGR